MFRPLLEREIRTEVSDTRTSERYDRRAQPQTFPPSIANQIVRPE